jgi:hypothetical protein
MKPLISYPIHTYSDINMIGKNSRRVSYLHIRKRASKKWRIMLSLGSVLLKYWCSSPFIFTILLMVSDRTNPSYGTFPLNFRPMKWNKSFRFRACHWTYTAKYISSLMDFFCRLTCSFCSSYWKEILKD